MMTSEETYNSIAYYIKDEVGYPYNYTELSIQQRVFVDSFVEEFDRDASEKISELQFIVEDLEVEVSNLVLQLGDGIER